MIYFDGILCSRCTGRHHSMECPQVRPTLLALGVKPARTAEPMKLAPRNTRPPSDLSTLVNAVMEATG
jgi:hypothetical protein